MGIAGIVSVIEQAGIAEGRRAPRIQSIVEEGLSGRPAHWRRFGRRTCRSAGCDAWNGGAGGGAEGRADVEVFGANQVVRRNPQIASADREALEEFAVNFQVGLFRVWNLAVVLDQ